MSHFPFATTIVEASVEFFERRLKTPLILSTGAIDGVTEARSTVRVRVDRREATGRGAVYLSDLWAWPDPRLPHAERERRLRELCEDLARHLPQWCGAEPAHPLELGMRLHQVLGQLDTPVLSARGMPVLARLLCGSVFDAALHDAVGRASERSAFRLYDEPCALPGVDALFPEEGAARAIRRQIRAQPTTEFPACVVVGPNEELAEHLEIWVVRRGYRRVKLKLPGKDADADAHRTVTLVDALRRLGVLHPWISVDTNEANPDAASVAAYLHRVAECDPRALDAIAYLEQPTSRDLRAVPQDWRPVTRVKPVVLDEGLTSLEQLDEARRQGWSGCALKTCKGHSFSLVTAAWAARHGWIVTLQDLTNPGYAAIHAALLAAYLPTANGLELNSPQFTPEANAEWLPRLALLLEPTDGLHRVSFATAEGLGSGV